VARTAAEIDGLMRFWCEFTGDPGLQRALVTPILRQSEETGQIEQRGESGVQTFWPKETSRSL
jgi:hypothetical protein